MKRTLLTILLFLAVLAGCSSPTTESSQEITKPTVSGQAVVESEARLPSEVERKQEAPSVAAAESIASAASPIRSKAALDAAVNRSAPPVSPPVWNRESYAPVKENGFVNAGRDPLSTFAIDVDTASYANARRFVNGGSLPPVGAVRIEELINAFSYDYPAPTGRDPVRISAEVGPSPFHREYRLARIGIKARELAKEELPPSNLVFLVDVSGSMQDGNKLPLLQQALPLLVRQLDGRDRVALVVYAGADNVVLPPTPGNRHREILAAISQLRAGGSTHASSGIRTAYRLARQHFIAGGNNRVILASDGDFNVGVSSRDELQRLIAAESKAGVHLTVLGFGMGNYHDDTMEILADKGNGNYAYIDSLREARKVLVREMSGTLFTLANDVKIQVEFNPNRVGAYRLIGYENRALTDEEFRDDRADGGEIGVGHRVTALYELIPAGHRSIPKLDPLRYQTVQPQASGSPELMTVKLRYKDLGEQSSRLLGLPVREEASRGNSPDFRFAAAVAGYGMLLTGSDHRGTFTWEQCLAMARSGRGEDSEGDRAEFIRLVEASRVLAGQRQWPETPDGPEAQPMLR